MLYEYSGSGVGIYTEFPIFFPSFPPLGIQTILERLLLSKASPPLWQALKSRQPLGSTKPTAWSRQAFGWLHLQSSPRCAFSGQAGGAQSTRTLSSCLWQLRAVCWSSCFPASSKTADFLLILLEAFVISEPNYHNTDFKLRLEIIFRNRKGKIFCREPGYQQRNIGREWGSAPAHTLFLESYFPHAKL